MLQIILVTLVVLISFISSDACKTVRLQSSKGRLDYELTQIPVDEQGDSELLKEFRDNGRPMYRYIENEGQANEEIFYLFHEKTSDHTGTARWVFASYKPVPKRAFRKFHLSFHALVESWAVLPQLVKDVVDHRAPRSHWQIKPTDKSSKSKAWIMDTEFTTTCIDPATADSAAIFFESSTAHQHHLSGFFVQRVLSKQHPAASTTSTVYTKIKIYPEDNLFALYDFHIGKNDDGSIARHWLISDDGIGGDAGVAFVADDNTSPDVIPDTATWNFIGSANGNPQERGWIPDPTARVLSVRKYQEMKQKLEEMDDETARVRREWRAFKLGEHHDDSDSSLSTSASASLSIMTVLRYLRALKTHPNNAMQQLLPNGVGMPRIGLGTGGISHEDSERVFTEALSMGYQLFDLAREYGNEHIMGHVASYNRDDDAEELRRFRAHVFYETKVWPTNLGFEPTIHEVLASLGDLRTHYIDLYLLHWPTCNKEIEWMHCADTVDPQGTWQQSWKALEKMYAEGYLQAIGVSNFDMSLLQQMETKIASVLPHVVQNYASMDFLDSDVRLWCSVRGIAYQPYASIRNVRTMPRKTRELLQSMVEDYAEQANQAELQEQPVVNEHTLLLRFFLQTGACIIPRATKEEHLHANLQLWSWGLEEEDIERLGWDLEKFHKAHREHAGTAGLMDNDIERDDL